tara:strand:- start:239 stop:1048 length:810 start_codon:yes stop_codon:yes gene_type:complete
MPTADSFAALGKGNGFPFCVTRKIDVSSKEKWTTLGGTQKGSSPSNSEIQTSLANAVKIFWNTNELLGSVASSKTSTALPSIIYRKKDSSVFNPTTDPEQPKDRACGRSNYFDYRNYYTVGQSNSQKLGFINLMIMRMYNGDSSNENNFVGYGLESGFGVSTISNDEPGPSGDPPSAGDARVFIDVGSLLVDYSVGRTDGTFEFDTAYKTFNGFPMVVSVLATATAGLEGSEIEFEADASAISGSASYSNSDISGSVSASITGLDLYTY